MALTLDQKIAQKETELARLRSQSRKLETGQKIILGGMLLNEARHDAEIRKWLLRKVEESIKREVDQKRLGPLLDELKALPSSSSSS